MISLLDRAAALADDVLQPAAAEVDASGVIPPSHFAALAAAGLYGVALAEPAALPAVTEVLAAGCLATAFTWMQHHGPMRTLAGLGDPRVGVAAAGALRCGVALAGAVPDPPLLWATRVDGGWRLDGQAPLVTGWGLIDLVLVAARDVATADAPDEDALIVTALLDAHAAPGLTARPLALLAADASRTVQLRFDGVHLPDELVTGQTMRTAFLAGMTASARVNGALALGVAGRCVRLIADTGRADALAEQLRVDLDATRAELDAALAAAFAEQAPDAGSPPAGGIPACAPPSAATGAPPGAAARMATARAAASALAHRAAGALVVAAGSRALLHDHPAGRLVREAAFTLVAAGRAEIRTELLHRLAGCP
ncbi:MAG TPA: acyl-CoA dehydrogenase family protein [Pseudonocardia sp.]|nr:acyl-CoA dehydrogenase family protein [Pseudonocardia sp.]